MDAPIKITAWVKMDGTAQFEGGTLFPRGVEAKYIREDVFQDVAKALKHLVTCVNDGCFCSEMEMATAIDNAESALKKAK